MAVHHWLVIIERLLEYLKIKSSESLLFKSELMLKNLNIYIYIYIDIYIYIYIYIYMHALEQNIL